MSGEWKSGQRGEGDLDGVIQVRGSRHRDKKAASDRCYFGIVDMAKQLSITLRRSCIGHPGKHKRVALGLGLRKLNQTVLRVDTPEIRGMVRKISHLLDVEEIS